MTRVATMRMPHVAASSVVYSGTLLVSSLVGCPLFSGFELE